MPNMPNPESITRITSSITESLNLLDDLHPSQLELSNLVSYVTRFGNVFNQDYKYVEDISLRLFKLASYNSELGSSLRLGTFELSVVLARGLVEEYPPAF